MANKTSTILKSHGSLWAKLGIEYYGLLIVLCSSVGLLLWRLEALTSNLLSASEINTKHQLYINSPWWRSLESLYGPYYLLLHATFAIHHNVLSLRLASVIAALVVVGMTYWLVSSWHGYKIGLMVAAATLVSFGLLAAGREATPLITQLIVLPALILSVSHLFNKPTYFGLLLLGIVLAGVLYVPGGIWFVICTKLLGIKPIKVSFKKLSKIKKVIVTLTPLALITPLIFQLSAHYSLSQLKLWLGYGLNGSLTHSAHVFLMNLLYTPMDLFIHSYNLSHNISLGHLPLLSIALSVIVALGLYSYFTRLNNWRWRSVLILLGLAWLMSGFGVISPLALLPLLFISAGTGLAFLLKEWYEVFPRNPIARSCGLIIMFAVIGLNTAYVARSYFVGWANNPLTTSLYSYRLKK